MPTLFDDRTGERFGDIERQQQRKPLARATIAAQHARSQQRERQCLQHEPRAVRRKWREHELPQYFEREQRERAGNGETRCQWTATNS